MREPGGREVSKLCVAQGWSPRLGATLSHANAGLAALQLALVFDEAFLSALVQSRLSLIRKMFSLHLQHYKILAQFCS